MADSTAAEGDGAAERDDDWWALWALNLASGDLHVATNTYESLDEGCAEEIVSVSAGGVVSITE